MTKPLLTTYWDDSQSPYHLCCVCSKRGERLSKRNVMTKRCFALKAGQVRSPRYHRHYGIRDTTNSGKKRRPKSPNPRPHEGGNQWKVLKNGARRPYGRQVRSISIFHGDSIGLFPRTRAYQCPTGFLDVWDAESLPLLTSNELEWRYHATATTFFPFPLKMAWWLDTQTESWLFTLDTNSSTSQIQVPYQTYLPDSTSSAAGESFRYLVPVQPYFSHPSGFSHEWECEQAGLSRLYSYLRLKQTRHPTSTLRRYEN